MMSCEEFQLHAGAEPRALSWRKLLHLLLCRTCARYSRSVRALDLHIERALALDVPARGSVVSPLEPRHFASRRQ
jgi:hypothetical protein